MLKHLAILAVLAGALSPIPGTAIKSPTQSGDNGKSQSQGDQVPAMPALSSVKEPIQAGSSEKHGGTVAGKDKEHSVKLTSLPPITVADKTKGFWDHVLDWGPWISNFLLVAVGGLQVWLLLRTWKTIERQADIMDGQAKDAQESGAKTIEIALVTAQAAQKSADSSLAQIQAIIDKERARIFISPSVESFQLNLRSAAGIGIGSYGFTLFNVGPTPAINIFARYRAVATEFETGAEGEAGTRATVPEVIRANGEANTPLFIESAFSSGKGGVAPQLFYIHIFGEVEYNDVISPNRRSTKFRFRIQMQQIRGDGTAVPNWAWDKFGREEDNRTT